MHFLDVLGGGQISEECTEPFGDQTFILTKEMPSILLEKVERFLKS